MSVTNRMIDLLGEEGAALAADAEEMLNPNDLAQKAAEVLIVGLKADLPDEADLAFDAVMNLLRDLRTHKKVLIQRTIRRMSSRSRAMGVARDVRAGI